MITQVTPPPTDLARAPSAADGAGASKPKASSFADDLANIMGEADAEDETAPTSSQPAAAPPAPPEKSSTPAPLHSFHPISPSTLAAATKSGEASNDDQTERSPLEQSDMEKITAALVSQNGKAAAAEAPPSDPTKHEDAKKDDTKKEDAEQDAKAKPNITPDLPLPVAIIPTPPLITAPSEPSSANPLVAGAVGSPAKSATARASTALQAGTSENETEGADGQNTGIDQKADAFILKRTSPAMAGQAKATNEGSHESQHLDAANNPSAEPDNAPALSGASTLPLDILSLNNGLTGADGLAPKKPLAIETLEALASRPAPPSPSSGPVPYVMLPIEIGLGALQGRRAIEVRLSPDDLDTVEIRLEISDDSKVSANITADRPATLAMMMNDASKLRAALDQTGMTTTADTLQFSLKQDGNFTQSNGQNAEQRQNGQPQSQRRDGSPPPPFQDAVPIASLRRAAGLLDVNI